MAAAAAAVAALLAGCTQTTYTAFEGGYDPYLREKVFERYIIGTVDDKRRSMRFALGDLRRAEGVPYSADFFQRHGFSCEAANICSLTVQKYVYRSKRVNLVWGDRPLVQAPGDFGDVATIIHDTYTVSYTPTSIDVAVTSEARDYMAP
ncbi:hypothetical protein [Rhodoligotrophos defluvii]|uniref:hypothetical protein n=1 Tax=Rhodoligotrophos defluvii TaxID=2561934 RepID=UPI001485AA6E|nr:hypothetical protein [Rhodoligotrophos defluvii]